MPPTRRTLLQTSAIGVLGSIAGIGSANEQSQTETPDGTSTPTTDSTPYSVEVTTNPQHGVILTDAAGMTLYQFTNDEDGESTCYDDCADAWPPLTVEESPSIPDGLPGEFSTTARDDGSTQVTYNGMPLYYFAKDEEPGDTMGQGVDAWFIVNPACPGETSNTTETATEPGGY